MKFQNILCNVFYKCANTSVNRCKCSQLLPVSLCKFLIHAEQQITQRISEVVFSMRKPGNRKDVIGHAMGRNYAKTNKLQDVLRAKRFGADFRGSDRP